MRRRENYLLLLVVVLLALALCIVLPVNSGILGNKKFQEGIDIKGGTYLLYQADLSKSRLQRRTHRLWLPSNPRLNGVLTAPVRLSRLSSYRAPTVSWCNFPNYG